MAEQPRAVADFLGGGRIAVAGVSRTPAEHSGNPVYRRLRDAGYDVVPVNPHASEVEGAPCYPDVAAVPGPLAGVVVATHPDVSIQVVRDCGRRGVRRVWFHRSLGTGSVSDAAVRECEALGIESIVGGCPLLYVEPVDVGHRCLRWWLQWRGQLPR
jgi:hypothetical protein